MKLSKKFEARRAKTHTTTTGTVLTDQSQADNTNINRIVKKWLASAVPPTANAQPMYGDFTQLPRNLKSMYEHARQIDRRRSQLPEQLRNLPVDELLNLTAEQLAEKLKPADKPADPPAPTPEPPNKE